MSRFLALLFAAGCVLPAGAQPADRLGSAECQAARAELEAALDDPAAGRAARAERLAQARGKVLVTCLGPASAQPQRSGAPQPAVAVPAPIVSAPPAASAQPAAAPPPLPPADVPRPAFVTTCDPAGCWDNEGRRLNNLGPLLMGPRGLCTLQGGVVNCP